MHYPSILVETMKKIYITGLAGFIGFHLATHLKKRGDFVIGIDNFNDYYDVRLKRQRAKILENLGISCIEGDICDAVLMEKTVSQHQITHFVHLAAQAGVRYSLVHPEAYVHSNLAGFVSIMELCRRHPPMPCIYASSSSVYGLNQKQPFSETDTTDSPANLYGATKKANELIAYSYHHLYGIPVTGLRFFTVYGPWGRPDMAYFSFTKNIHEGKPIQVYNAGNMFRDFTYIDDIIAGVIAAIDKEYACEIFNLGNNSPESVQELIHLIELALGRKAVQHLMPMQPGDVPATFADIDKSAEMLRFSPKTPLKEGIDRFVKWYLKERL
jgi:UDP-glucuronate 4-epimerase